MRRKRINWQFLLKTLISKGMTETSISRRTGIGAPHISLILSGKRGSRLSYEEGAEIVKLCHDLGIDEWSEGGKDE